MPTYEFQDSDGRYVALDFPIGTAPKIGTTTRIGGRRLTRLASIPASLKVAPNVGFNSISLPLDWRYAPRVDPVTREAVFHSQREVRESLARANDHNEKLVYE